VLPVVSSAVFLSVGPSLSSSFQLLGRGFSFAMVVEKASVGKREKEGEEAGKHALLTKRLA
jgi:hypothetical protein